MTAWKTELKKPVQIPVEIYLEKKNKKLNLSCQGSSDNKSLECP